MKLEQIDSVVKQVEFYLSDANLRRDSYFMNELEKNNGFLSLKTLSNCNALAKNLLKNSKNIVNDLKEAIKSKSDSSLVFDEEKIAVSRKGLDLEAIKNSSPGPQFLIANLPLETDKSKSQELIQGLVDEIVYFTFRDELPRKLFRPFAFVEFKDPSIAKKNMEEKFSVLNLESIPKLCVTNPDYEEDKIYYLPESTSPDEFFAEALNAFGKDPKAIVDVSFHKKSLTGKKDISQEAIDAFFENAGVTPSKTLLFGRHCFVEMASEEDKNTLYSKRNFTFNREKFYVLNFSRFDAVLVASLFVDDSKKRKADVSTSGSSSPKKQKS